MVCPSTMVTSCIQPIYSQMSNSSKALKIIHQSHHLRLLISLELQGAELCPAHRLRDGIHPGQVVLLHILGLWEETRTLADMRTHLLRGASANNNRRQMARGQREGEKILKAAKDASWISLWHISALLCMLMTFFLFILEFSPAKLKQSI